VNEEKFQKVPTAPESPQMDGWVASPEILPLKMPKEDQGRSDMREKVDSLNQENRSLKEKFNAMQKRDDMISAQNSRLERELAKVTRHVSRLLDNKDESNKSAVEEIRRENEKMLVVSRLREQVSSLEKELKTKNELIASLQRSQTGTAVLELAVSRDEVWTECSRLRASIKEMEALYQAEASDLRKQVSLLTRENEGPKLNPTAPAVAEEHKLNANSEVTTRKLSALRCRVEELEREKQELTSELRRAASDSDRIALESKRMGTPTPILSNRRRQKNEFGNSSDSKEGSGIVNDILKGVGVDMLDSSDREKKTKRKSRRHKAEKTDVSGNAEGKENSASKLRAKAQAAQGGDKLREKAKRQREEEAAMAVKASREAAAQAGAAIAARRVAKRMKDKKQAALDREASKTEVTKIYEAAKQQALQSLATPTPSAKDNSGALGAYAVYYRVWLTTNSTPKAAAKQIRALNLDRCASEIDLTLEDLEDGRGDRFLMRAMVWDDPNSEPGSGFSRTHRTLNRLALTLSNAHFGLVDKIGSEFVVHKEEEVPKEEPKDQDSDDSVFGDVGFEEDEEDFGVSGLVDEDGTTQFKFEVEVKVSSPDGKKEVLTIHEIEVEPVKKVMEPESEVESPMKVTEPEPEVEPVITNTEEPEPEPEVENKLDTSLKKQSSGEAPMTRFDNVSPIKTISPIRKVNRDQEAPVSPTSISSPKAAKSPKKHGSSNKKHKSPKKRASVHGEDNSAKEVKSATTIQAVHRGHSTRRLSQTKHKKKSESIKEDKHGVKRTSISKSPVPTVSSSPVPTVSSSPVPTVSSPPKQHIVEPVRNRSFDEEYSVEDELEESDDTELKQAEMQEQSKNKKEEDARLQAEARAAAEAVKRQAAQKAEEERMQAEKARKEREVAAQKAEEDRLQADRDRKEKLKERRDAEARLAAEMVMVPPVLVKTDGQDDLEHSRSEEEVKDTVVGSFSHELSESHSPTAKTSPLRSEPADIDNQSGSDDYDDEDFADYEEDFEDDED